MHKIFIMTFALFSTLLTTACSEAAFGIANIPVKLSDVKIEKNIAYGEDKLQNLDIYIPPELKDKKAPVVVFIHGGRWTFGNKDQYAFIGNSFAQKGYVTVLINHRKYPKVKFPVFVEDGAKAVAWVYNNIDKYNGDKNSLFISGHSSGAHIGSLIATDKQYLKEYNLSPDVIEGFAGMAGPYDFIPEADDLKDMFGPPSNYSQMQVSTFIEGDEPPMLFLWGEKDKTVIYRNIKMVKDKINEQNGRVNVVTYDDMNHVGIIKDFAWVNINNKQVLNDITVFFEKYIK